MHRNSASFAIISNLEHFPDKLLGILNIGIDLVLLENLSMLGQVVLVHLLDLPLKLVLFFIQQLHVGFQEFLYVQVVVTSATRLRYCIKVLFILSSQTSCSVVFKRLLRILVQITQLSI